MEVRILTTRPPELARTTWGLSKSLEPIPDLPDLTTNLAQRRNDSSSYKQLLAHCVCQEIQAGDRRCPVVEIGNLLLHSSTQGITGDMLGSGLKEGGCFTRVGAATAYTCMLLTTEQNPFQLHSALQFKNTFATMIELYLPKNYETSTIGADRSMKLVYPNHLSFGNSEQNRKRRENSC